MSLNEYQNLTDNQKSEFKEVINALLSQNYVVEEIYNPMKSKMEKNHIYRFIYYNKHLISEYLDMMGWALIEDDINSVYAVKSEFFSSAKLNRTTTIFLLVIHLIYEENKKKASLQRDVCIRLSEVLNKFDIFKLFDKNPNVSEIRMALTLLKKHQLVDKLQGDYSDPDCMLVIYPSIIHAVSNEDLLEILKQFESANNRQTKKDEDTVINIPIDDMEDDTDEGIE